MKDKYNFKTSKKYLKKYKYTFWKRIWVILLFPIVYPLSWFVTLFFNAYLFKYDRKGLDKNGDEVNTFNHFLKDIKAKKLKNLEIDPNAIKAFEIQHKKNQSISCVMLNNKTSKWVVALHGFKRNKYLGIRNAINLFKQGYNVVSFDAFAHGDTFGEYSDFGVTNSKLLNTVISWIKSNNKVEEIGVIGVSMGGGTAVYWAQQFYLTNKVDWLVSDCALTQPVEQIRFFLKRYFKWFAWYFCSFNINGRFKKVSKTNLNDMNTQINLESIKDLPILFIHGKKDDFITYHNSIVTYYEQKKYSFNSLSELKLFENARHSESIVKHQDEYNELINNFIKKVKK
ncbi:alpha/beta hydrolase [Mesoplasma corruscae]|uniref:Hydrolase n=1 Tax=Mesoplasma corruscae TaxID=216874 RepID=A0A2S5RE86_9MOLU|nr:alpha/beta fold hydrolase [Mesoplasma corruscae]PPE05636.1 hydrolase [Mesoplasma corruscae]